MTKSVGTPLVLRLGLSQWRWRTRPAGEARLGSRDSAECRPVAGKEAQSRMLLPPSMMRCLALMR
jgi:hypothetical protein